MSRNLTRTSVLLGFLNLLVKPVSMGKEILVGSLFGTSAAMDAFFIALGIPNLIIGLMSSPIAGSFTPLLVGQKDADARREFARRVLGWLLLSAVLVAIVLVVFRDAAIRLAGPGLAPEVRGVATGALVLLAPYLVFQVVSEFQRSALVAMKRFLLAVVWPVFLPTAVIVACLVFPTEISVLATSMAVGAGLVAVATGYSLRRVGIGGIGLPRRTPSTDAMARQVPFLLLSGALLQANVFVDRLMASTLEAGSVSALNYAFRLLMLLQMVFVAPFTQLLLPFFSEHFARGEWSALAERVDRATRSALVMLMPICIFGMVFGREAVSFVYERGEFTAQSSYATGMAFIAYLPSFLVLGVTMAYPRYFNAARKNQVLLVQSTCSLIANVLFNFLFMRWFGHVGIALSTSVTILLGRMILFAVMERDLRDRHRLQTWRHLGTFAAGVAVFFALKFLYPWMPTPGGHLFLRLVVGFAVTAVLYTAVVMVFRRTDVLELVRALRRNS